MKKVRFLRHCTAIFLAAAFALSLTGCGGKIEEAPAVSAQSAPENSAGAALKVLPKADDKGLYTTCLGLKNDPQVINYIYYIDFESLTGVPLCAKPNCTHNTEDCTGCFLTKDNAASTYLRILNQNTLVYILSASHGSAPQQLCFADRDGTNRRSVYTLSSGERFFPDQYPLISDGESLYFITRTASLHSVTKLYQLSVSGGEPEVLLTLNEDETGCPTLLGTHDRTILFGLQSDDNTAEQPFRLTAFDVDIKKQKELPIDWLPENFELLDIHYGIGKLWAINTQKKAPFFWYDLSSGESGELAVQWPADVIEPSDISFLQLDIGAYSQQMDLPGGKILTWNRHADDDGLFRYAIDPVTGIAQLVPFRLVGPNEYGMPIFFVAVTPDGPMLNIEQTHDNRIVVVDGAPLSEPVVHDRYALISWEDFFAGNINFKEISGDFYINFS